jgi:hypothetical protein
MPDDLYLLCHLFQATIRSNNRSLDLVVAASDKATANAQFWAKLEHGLRLRQAHGTMPYASRAAR